jgi:hypothetical protein
LVTVPTFTKQTACSSALRRNRSRMRLEAMAWPLVSAVLTFDLPGLNAHKGSAARSCYGPLCQVRGQFVWRSGCTPPPARAASCSSSCCRLAAQARQDVLASELGVTFAVTRRARTRQIERWCGPRQGFQLTPAHM